MISKLSLGFAAGAQLLLSSVQPEGTKEEQLGIA